MHTLRLNEKESLWQVGHYEPISEPGAYVWHMLLEYGEEADAMRMVNYLNGGAGDPMPK